jgi:predicted amidohydrolase YtcJ
VLDLNGTTLFPGIIDAHTHLMTLGENSLKLDLKDVDPNEAVARVKQRVARVRPGEWIIGWGWDEGKWAAEYPTNAGLNEVAPNNPVFLSGLHSFAAWVNDRAMAIAAIDHNTSDPANGQILRDSRGIPTGILTNRAQELVTRHIPPLTFAQVKEAIQIAAAQCLKNGLTSVHEARVTPMMVRAFRELVRENKLPLRVYAMLDAADTKLIEEWLKKGPQIDRAGHRFTVRSIKVFADGALGSRGAALFEPYSDQPSTTGLITTPQDKLYQLARRCLQTGFQMATHAIGDRANRIVLDTYQRALSRRPGTDARFRIEHAQVLSKKDIPRFAKLNVIASMQPTHCTSDMIWAEKRVGPERIKSAYAWRSLLDSGARVPISSDFPGETVNPFFGIYAAITRQNPEGEPPGGWYPEQRMTLAEALRGYTIEAAFAEFQERTKGSIEAGKLADLIVISKDITRIAPQELLTIEVLKTFVGGRLVYEAKKQSPVIR